MGSNCEGLCHVGSRLKYEEVVRFRAWGATAGRPLTASKYGCEAGRGNIPPPRHRGDQALGLAIPCIVSQLTKALNQPVLVVSFGYMPKP